MVENAGPDSSDAPAVLRAHMDAVRSGDPDAMAADYADEAIIERPGQLIEGRPAIATYFRGVPARLAGGHVHFESVDVHGPDRVTFHWRIEGGPADGTSGSDLVFLGDGLITFQRVHLNALDF